MRLNHLDFHCSTPTSGSNSDGSNSSSSKANVRNSDVTDVVTDNDENGTNPHGTD